MSKFNIIITNKNRDKYLDRCIAYLDHANEIKFNVNVYIVQNKKHTCNAKNIKISYITINDDGDTFNKSKYINAGFKRMRKKYDYFLQWDCDVLAVPELFYLIDKYGEDWNVLSGVKIGQSETENFFKQENIIDIKTLQVDQGSVFENKNNRYVGLIALKRECLQKYMDIMQIDAPYNENFGNFRGEDSQLSINSTRLFTIYRLINKHIFYDCWRHLYHENTGKALNPLDQQSAIVYLNDCLIHDEKKIKDYLGYK